MAGPRGEGQGSSLLALAAARRARLLLRREEDDDDDDDQVEEEEFHGEALCMSLGPAGLPPQLPSPASVRSPCLRYKQL